MGEIIHEEMSRNFERDSRNYQMVWGAFTMGVAFRDELDSGIPLHHQIHLSEEDKTEGLYSGSIFVSLSHPSDEVRSPDGMRTMNISTRVVPEWWFNLNGRYEDVKNRVQEQILEVVVKSLPGFSKAQVEVAFSSTPVTWCYVNKQMTDKPVMFFI